MTMITIEDRPAGATPDLQAYVARPEGDGPWPGVVMIHEAFGLDDGTRRHADRMADLGYLVIAPDLFTGSSMRKCLRRTFAEMKTGDGFSFANIAAARRWLTTQTDCTEKIGIVGFCRGAGSPC